MQLLHSRWSVDNVWLFGTNTWFWRNANQKQIIFILDSSPAIRNAVQILQMSVATEQNGKHFWNRKESV